MVQGRYVRDKRTRPKYLILEDNMDVEEGSRGADGWALAVGPRRRCTLPVLVGLHAPSRKRWGIIRDLQESCKPILQGGLVGVGRGR